MKKAKSLLTLIFIIGSVTLVSAQRGAPDNVLNIGVGPGYHGGYAWGKYRSAYFGPSGAVSPVLSLSLDHKIKKAGPGDITIGGAVEFGTRSYTHVKDQITYTGRSSVFALGVRVAYYPEFTSGEDWDAYVAVNLGFGVVSMTDTYWNKNYVGVTQPKSSYPIGYGAFLIGGHYYFNKSFGMFAEVGADITPVKIGVAFKF